MDKTIPLVALSLVFMMACSAAPEKKAATPDDAAPPAEQTAATEQPASEQHPDGPAVHLDDVSPQTFEDCRRIEDNTVGRIYVCERQGFVAVFSVVNDWDESEKRNGLADFAEGVIRSIYGFGDEFRFEVDKVALGGEEHLVLDFDGTQIDGLESSGAQFSLQAAPDGERVVGCAALPKIGFQSCEKILNFFYQADGADAIDTYLEDLPVRLAGRELSVPDECEKLDTRTIRCPTAELVIAPVVEPNLIAAEAALHSEQLTQFEKNCQNGYDSWEDVCSVDEVPTNCYLATCKDQGHAQIAAMAKLRDMAVAVSCRFNTRNSKTLPSLCQQVLQPNDMVVPPPTESAAP